MRNLRKHRHRRKPGEQSVPGLCCRKNRKPVLQKKAKPRAKRPANRKIKAIRTTLFHIAQEEEEEAVSLRVAYQIRQVKDQKEHPEKYPPPPPRVSPKPKKKTFGQKMLDLFPQRGDSGGEVVRKSIFLFSAAVFLVCVVLIVLYFVDIFRADKM